MTCLGYIFSLDVSIFTTTDDEKEVKINSSSILKDLTESSRESFGNSLTLFTLDNLNTQKIEFHTNSEDISQIKLTSLLPSAQNSHLITSPLLVLNIAILFDSKNCLASYHIWVIESKCTSSHFFISYA